MRSSTHFERTILILWLGVTVGCGLTKQGTERTDVSSQVAKASQGSSEDTIPLYESPGEGAALEAQDPNSLEVLGFGLSKSGDCKCKEIWGNEELKKCKKSLKLLCDKDKNMAFQFQGSLVYCWGGKKSDCDYKKLLAKAAKN